MTFEKEAHLADQDRRARASQPATLMQALRARVEAGMPVKVKPVAQAIGISTANLYSMIAAEKIEVVRPSERRIVIPAHEARRLLGMGSIAA